MTNVSTYKTVQLKAPLVQANPARVMTSKKERLNKYMLEVVGDTTFFEQDSLKKQWQTLRDNQKGLVNDIGRIKSARERVIVVINQYLQALKKIEEVEKLLQKASGDRMSAELKDILEYFGTVVDEQVQSEIVRQCESWCREQKPLVVEKLLHLLAYSQQLLDLETAWDGSLASATADVEIVRQRISPYLISSKLLDVWSRHIALPLEEFITCHGACKLVAIGYGISIVPVTSLMHFIFHQAWLTAIGQAFWMPVALLIEAAIMSMVAVLIWYIFGCLVVRPTAGLIRGYSLEEATLKKTANWYIAELEKLHKKLQLLDDEIPTSGD